MKHHTAAKSSITLSPAEHARVLRLRRELGVRSNTEVIRRSLALLEGSLLRKALRDRFRRAARQVRASSTQAIRELDPLAGEGLADG